MPRPGETSDRAPALRAERRVRHAWAAPVVAAASSWVDLGSDAPEGAVAADPADLDSLRELLAASDIAVTAFDVIEGLPGFAPLVGLLVDASSTATVLLSVANDAYWPHAQPGSTTWGEGAFAELRSLLPEGHVIAEQVALQGSAIGPGRHDLAVQVEDDPVPSHFLVAFGPRAAEVAGAAEVAPVDLGEQRAFERRRDSDLALLRGANA